MIYKFLPISFLFFRINAVPTVTTPRGTLFGFHYSQGNDISRTWYGEADVFLGVPFALPPTGNLRYKHPRPLLTFPDNPYNATFFRAECIQPIKGIDTSEDCLYLDIWTPNVTSTTKYPVMVYIHGGGLITGSDHMGNNGIVRNFVYRGIVFTSIDYRMSWLGFFTTFTDDFPPNLGMLDQTLALKFIKEEIGYFGGDPNRITILGQSAGGHSVSALSYSPLSQNLFQQYIASSGTVFTCLEDVVGPTNLNFLMAQKACNYTQEMWDSKNFTALKDCLMNINASDGEAIAWNVKSPHEMCWNMVQDNYFFPGTPKTLAPKRPNIPAMIGTCKDEYSFMAMSTVQGDTNLTGFIRDKVERNLLWKFNPWFVNASNGEKVLKICEDNYLPPGATDDDHMAWLQFVVDFGTSIYFSGGELRDAQFFVNNKNPNVFLYEFVWSSPINDDGDPLPNWHPVPHGCELPYVYGYGSGGNWDATNQNLAKVAQDSWANFVIYGKPSLNDTWKPATSTNFTAMEYFEFNNVSTPKVGYRYKDQITFNQAIPQVLGDYPPNIPDNTPGYQSKVKNNVCYEAIGNPETFTNALTNCVQNSYGTLVTIGSAFENSDLLAYAKNAYPSCTGFYIGLYKSTLIPNNSNWTWVNYDTNGYRNWKSGSPNQDSFDSCVVLNANDGTWTNQACTTNQCYICSTIF